jgi:hypothetical protein
MKMDVLSQSLEHETDFYSVILLTMVCTWKSSTCYVVMDEMQTWRWCKDLCVIGVSLPRMQSSVSKQKPKEQYL